MIYGRVFSFILLVALCFFNYVQLYKEKIKTASLEKLIKRCELQKMSYREITDIFESQLSQKDRDYKKIKREKDFLENKFRLTKSLKYKNFLIRLNKSRLTPNHKFELNVVQSMYGKRNGLSRPRRTVWKNVPPFTRQER